MGQLRLNESIPRKGDFLIEKRGGWEWLSLSLCDISLVVLRQGEGSPFGQVAILWRKEVTLRSGSHLLRGGGHPRGQWPPGPAGFGHEGFGLTWQQRVIGRMGSSVLPLSVAVQ